MLGTRQDLSGYAKVIGQRGRKTRVLGRWCLSFDGRRGYDFRPVMIVHHAGSAFKRQRKVGRYFERTAERGDSIRMNGRGFLSL